MTDSRAVPPEAAAKPVSADQSRAAIADAERQLRTAIMNAYLTGQLSDGLTDQLSHDAAVLAGTGIGALSQRTARIAELEERVAVLEVRHAETDELVQAGERERIRQLAETHQAVYTPACLPGECGPMCGQTASFADLLADGND